LRVSSFHSLPAKHREEKAGSLFLIHPGMKQDSPTVFVRLKQQLFPPLNSPILWIHKNFFLLKTHHEKQHGKI
jgi:hypothetical protein